MKPFICWYHCGKQVPKPRLFFWHVTHEGPRFMMRFGWKINQHFRSDCKKKFTSNWFTFWVVQSIGHHRRRPFDSCPLAQRNGGREHGNPVYLPAFRICGRLCNQLRTFEPIPSKVVGECHWWWQLSWNAFRLLSRDWIRRRASYRGRQWQRRNESPRYSLFSPCDVLFFWER